MRGTIGRANWILLVVFLSLETGGVAAPDDVTFPAPIRAGGRGLFTVLQGRTHTENFDARLLHWEVLGNLLWAGCGVNRADQGERTVPVMGPSFAVRLYLLAAEGVWLYEPLSHRLVGTRSGDFRALATTGASPREGALGMMPFAVERASGAPESAAPVVLLYVADALVHLEGLAQSQTGVADRGLVFAALQAGHIAQNIQLFGVSEGLGIQTHTAFAQPTDLARQLGLASSAQILMAQSVGYALPR